MDNYKEFEFEEIMKINQGNKPYDKEIAHDLF